MAERSWETTRLIAHVLLDAVSSWTPGLDQPVNEEAMDLALQRVLDVGGVTVTKQSEGEVEVDVSAVVDAATVLTFYFCDLVALLSEVERETVVTVARLALDSHAESED